MGQTRHYPGLLIRCCITIIVIVPEPEGINLPPSFREVLHLAWKFLSEFLRPVQCMALATCCKSRWSGRHSTIGHYNNFPSIKTLTLFGMSSGPSCTNILFWVYGHTKSKNDNRDSRPQENIIREIETELNLNTFPNSAPELPRTNTRKLSGKNNQNNFTIWNWFLHQNWNLWCTAFCGVSFNLVAICDALQPAT